MIKNYIKTAWRNLWKNKIFSALNIAGLAVGMAACIVIMSFVFYEKSFDNFHTKNIYRLNEVQSFPGMVSSQKVGLSMYPMGPTLKNEFPQVKNFTRVKWNDKYQVTYQDKRMFLPQAFSVDSTFLQMFDFKLIAGDRKTALEKPNSIVLTQATAKKIFGDVNPLGKTITHYGNDTVIFAVTGILQDIPKNSQMQFDCLFSFSSVYHKWMNRWGGNWLDTYVELAPGTDATILESKLPAYMLKYSGRPDITKFYKLFFLPLKDVHANAADIGLDYINYQKFDKKATNLFAIIALIVLLIACINFMNLSTARSAERAREVGVRKSIGARRLELAVQFLSETIMLSLFALVAGMILVWISLPYINNLSGRDISINLWASPGTAAIIIGFTIVVGIVSGIYPAVYLSSFKPVQVLKGSTESGGNKGTFRNVLVVGQFTSAVFLMIATFFVVKQLRYMQQQDPGFTRDQVVTVPLDGNTDQKYDVLKQQLLSSSLITGVTAAQDVLGSHLDQTGVTFKPKNGPAKQLALTQLVVDNNYLNLFGIKLIAGKNFSPAKSASGREYIINEELAHELLKDQPKNTPIASLIGQSFGNDSLGVITGISKNFNFNSLHYKVETMFMFNQRNWGYSQLSVKINGGKTNEALAFIKSVWTKNFPDRPFEYQFLDDHFNDVYKADAQISKIVSILAGLAIIISCLGLFGLASYAAEKRVKEIGVRKVLGASVQSIVLLLSGQFVKLVLMANLLAWPLAWYAMHKWLQSFAYRIDIKLSVFVFTAVLSLFIALLTISFQSVKAAIANPVKSLRSE
ncbi:ABC transporter permease [Mucilaginibacter sp. UR6-11]|uniref:ABC transporter permease n=1 Tax=Mucilaginibacter sp. UR6-11 TaxID=1435644 RepID=UPI001E43FEF0|nr:ABC transporter permease [Mucilaginibacter sp. UR6-11]MCC8424892.1 ABC transporter permease [Mucilaginibacter sp. UR6-11]